MRRVLLFAALLIFASPAFATTYFMRADGASTKAAATACSSTATAMSVATHNASTFLPGDVITLCDTGGIYRAQLTVPSSGAFGNPIVYTNSGTPILAGSNVVTTWTLVTGTTYSATSASTPINVYEDDPNNGTSTVPLLKQSSLANCEATPGSWFYTGTTLNVNLIDGTNPTGHTMEASVRQLATSSSGHSFITIQNLYVKQVTSIGIYFENSGTPTGSAGTYFNNNFNEFQTVQGNTVWNYGGTTFSGAYEGGIYIRGFNSGTPPPLRGEQILNNTIGRMDAAAVLANDNGGIMVLGTTGALISGNSVNTTTNQAIRVSDDFGGQSCASPTITNNFITGSELNISIAGCPSSTASYNEIINSAGSGIQIGQSTASGGTHTSTSPIFIYNVLFNLAESADATNFNGFDINNASTNGVAYGNTIVQVSSSSMTLEADSGASNGWTVKNNIFDCRQNADVGGVGNHYCFYIASGVTTTAFSNNTYSDLNAHLTTQFQHPLSTGIAYAAFETLVSGTSEQNVTDPMFTNASTGVLTLAAGSPAIGSGATMANPYGYAINPSSTWPSGVVIGWQGAWPSWNAGAYLFGSATGIAAKMEGTSHILGTSKMY